MKFTKEEASKELTAKIPQEGQTLNLSERSINEMLDKLLPLIANDEMELDAFVENVLPMFVVADGNVKHDVSRGIIDYKEKNPVIKKETPKKVDEDDAMAKALARIEELERKNAENEKKVMLSSRRSEIVSKMKEKGVKDKDWVDAFLDQVSFDGDDFDIETKVESYVQMYNKSIAIVNPDFTPRGAGGGNGEDKALSEVIKGASNFVKSQRLD
jgi:hypothetical protein